MGVSIECKKTGNNYSLGYGRFAHLRTKIAKLHNEEFGKLYGKLTDFSVLRMDKAEQEEWYRNFNQKIDEGIRAKTMDKKIVDFCLQSDCSGSIRYGACKSILKLIGDSDDADLSAFVEILRECVEHKCDCIWD